MNFRRAKFILLLFVIKVPITYCQNINTIEVDSIIYSIQKHFTAKNHEVNLPILNSLLPKCQNVTQIHRVTGMLMDCYLYKSQFDSVFDVAEYGHNAGAVYRIPSFYTDSLNAHPRYKKMIATNDSILQICKTEAKAECEIFLPENYNTENYYPLFIVLTKGYRSIPVLLSSYRSETIKKEFILVFIHSSDFRKTSFYEWRDNKKGREEIQGFYYKLLERYSIDTSSIIIGGMSNAGQMAIDLTFRGDLPISGFITFCSSNAKLLDNEISTSNIRNLKGVLIAGINDKRFFSHSIEMYEQLKDNKFNIKLKKGNFGHEIPKNSSLYIENAMEFFFK